MSQITALAMRAIEVSGAKMAVVDAGSGELLWCSSSFSHSDLVKAGAVAESDRVKAVTSKAISAYLSRRNTAVHHCSTELTTALGTTWEILVEEVADAAHTCFLVTLREGEAQAALESGQGAMSADIVTGLADRRVLEARLAGRFRSKTGPFALLFLDLDGFKQVNDSHGHLVGDDTLREIACRLKAALRDEDFIARFGGDEFAIIAHGVTTLREADPIVRRLVAAAEKPLDSTDELRVSASVGVALSVDGYESAEAMLRAADEGMYAQKRANGGVSASR